METGTRRWSEHGREDIQKDMVPSDQRPFAVIDMEQERETVFPVGLFFIWFGIIIFLGFLLVCNFSVPKKREVVRFFLRV